MADSAEAAKAVEPHAPDAGLGLRKGASPHEAATALSQRRKRVAGSIATLQPVAPGDAPKQPEEMARDAAESQGNGQDQAPEAQDGAQTAPTEGDDTREPVEEAGAQDFPTTLRGFAEALEVDVDDLSQALTIEGPNGEEISISELRAGHLRQSDYSRRQDELADQRREFEAERTRTLERAKQQIEVAENWLGVVATALQAGPSDAELANLASTDIERYHVEKARRDNLLSAYNQVVAQRQQMVDKANQEASDAKAKMVETEKAALVRMSQDKSSGVPSPNDPEKWPIFEGKMRQYLGSAGFPEKDVSEFLMPGNWSASQVRIIADAMYGREVRQNGAGAGKKVKHLPKVLKPGAPKDRQQSNAEVIAKARQRLQRQAKGREGDRNAVALLRAKRAARKSG